MSHFELNDSTAVSEKTFFLLDIISIILSHISIIDGIDTPFQQKGTQLEPLEHLLISLHQIPHPVDDNTVNMTDDLVIMFSLMLCLKWSNCES